LSDEEIRIAVAESEGWAWVKAGNCDTWRWSHPKELPLTQPVGWSHFNDSEAKVLFLGIAGILNYPDDLNAIRAVILNEAEKSGFGYQADYQLKLQLVIEHRRRDLNREQIGWWMSNATAHECCEAYLRTKGLWKD